LPKNVNQTEYRYCLQSEYIHILWHSCF